MRAYRPEPVPEDVDAARSVFEVRPGEVPLLLTTLGYSADRAGVRERKRIEELVRYGE